MARAPRQETIVLAANEQKLVPIPGRWLTILSNSVGTVDVAFDGGDFSPMSAGVPYPAAGGNYERVTFRETTGVGTTILAVFAFEQTPDNRFSPLAGAMAASLANIDTDTDQLALIHGHLATIETTLTTIQTRLAGSAVMTPIYDTTIAELGVDPAPTQIVVAAAGIKRIQLIAANANTGTIWIGPNPAVLDATHKVAELSQDGTMLDLNYSGNLYAYADSAAQVLYGYLVG